MTIKTVGIIGGLGPETTSRFYLEVINNCEKHYKKHRPPILIWNVPITYQAEYEEIMQGNFNHSMPTLLIEAARKLEKSDADFLVLPCNSSHFFINLIQTEISIPILNIINETINYLKTKKINKIGIISTLITRKKALYSNVLHNHGIQFTMPDNNDQKELNKIILNLTSKNYDKKEKNTLLKIIKKLKEQDKREILLACAALETLLPKSYNKKIHDTMKIYAAATVKKMLGNF